MDESTFDIAREKLPDPLGPLFLYWESIRGDRLVPRRSDFDPVDIPSLLPHLVLAEVLRSKTGDQVEDFRFRLIGTYVDERMNDRYTGRRLSEIVGKRPGTEIWNAYQSVVREKQPKVVSLNYVGPAENTKETMEIYLPLSARQPASQSSADSRVDLIVVGLRFA